MIESNHYFSACRTPGKRVAGRMLSVLVLAMIILSEPQAPVVEGRQRPVRTRRRHLNSRRTNTAFHGSQLGFLILDSPDEQGTEPVKQTSAQNPRNVLRTDVGDLANDFHAAMEAMNQVSEDIHVGKLLKACDRLAATMRKIGFTQGARDISGNIAKIRNLYDTAPSSHRDSMPALLQYEMELGVHGHGEVKRIKDPSAAMGFLWLGRTLNYQHDMFKYMLDEKEEPYNAAKHAYEQDLKHHHSWALQKVCQAAMVSLKSMKRSTVMSTLGGFHEGSFGDREDEATNRDLHHMMSFWRPMLSRWRQVFSDLQLENI